MRQKMTRTLTRSVMGRRDTRRTGAVLVRNLERHRKLVCLGRARHSRCRSAAHEGIRVESLEIRGD
jgi:hypothetical protein